jgi:hypothetical protein
MKKLQRNSPYQIGSFFKFLVIPKESSNSMNKFVFVRFDAEHLFADLEIVVG